MQKNPAHLTQLKNESFKCSEIDEDNDDDEHTWKNQPAEWTDDVRMKALFAAFRNRDLNPLFYDNKLKFWKETIASYCAEKELLQFDLTQLASCFMRKGIKPKCLELVLNEMIKDKVMLTRDEVLKPKPGLIKNIFNKLIWSPLSWSTSYLLRQTNVYKSSDSPSKTPYTF